MRVSRYIPLLALSGFMIAGFTVNLNAPPAAAAADDLRNQYAKQNCIRGEFKDYYLQGDGGDPPADYSGRVFKLPQDFPDQLPPREDYPWLSIGFVKGGPVDPEAYLRALLAYGLEGNVEADFYVEDNDVRSWYAMPWMDWNTEVASDWPGTDGREFVHGLTHEFDSSGKTLSSYQGEFVDTWSGAYFNGRAGFGIGQVYCDPESPDPSMLNPVPTARNNFADGSYVIKLLFTTIDESQLPILADTLEWQADVFIETDPTERNKGPISKFARKVQSVRLLQIDVAVRDDRSLTGWLMGTFVYDGRVDGTTVWDRMVPIGLQWGSNPSVTYSQSCPPGEGCNPASLDQQWINEAAAKEFGAPPFNLDHLGYGGRLAGPVDSSEAACMSCHQTAGFPSVPVVPVTSLLADVLGLSDEKEPDDHQDFRLMYYQNVMSGVTFSDSQLFSSDYSLQLSMSLQNFTALRCAANSNDPPQICAILDAWADARRRYIYDVLNQGTPGPGGAPLPGTNN